MSKIWYPYFQHKTMPEPLPVASAKGATIHLKNGQSLIDGISSWWSVIHGYANPVLDEAMKTQLNQMSHMMLCGLTHEPAQQLADTLIDITPPGLNHVFYSDSGSVGCEVALKTALQYWKNKGNQQKTKFLAFKKSYHGDTTGVMSVGDPDDGMHAIFKGLLLEQHFLPAPPTEKANQTDHAIVKLVEFLKQHHHECAAVIIEPLLQAAGGFNCYDPSFLVQLRALCDEYNVLLIFDEVATGFGRTGHLFAADAVQVSPDLMVLGKGLTGGYIGLAATLSTSNIFNAFYSDSPEHAFMHGPTFMGNPLACAVALASVKLCLESQFMPKIKKIEKQLKEALLNFSHANVADCRVLGATGVIETTSAKAIKGIQDYAREQGVWLRPFGNYIYTMPPYIISEDELDKVTTVMKHAVKACG
ncbi:adenosylmethionine--8-amino-7-oxononanoate transaminase [Candidatus Marinamargulisbacteria bacterium SCGC AG-414-C22]|nr:adenosylmethionine--8-amino-7-oxononanoate transaminase [Candidatus Marinamargulisbacteria bacterium SCGC AG-414-C22]